MSTCSLLLLTDFETSSVDISLPDVSDLHMRDVLVSIHEEMQKVKSGLPEVHLDVPRWNLDGALQGRVYMYDPILLLPIRSALSRGASWSMPFLGFNFLAYVMMQELTI